MKIHLPAIGSDLPFHPTLRDPRTGEPLQAIGRSKRGQLWWPIMGGSGEGDDSGDGDDGGDDDAGGDDQGDGGNADDLRDAGKKALDAMKAKWQKERDARKALEAQITKKGDDQTDPEEIRRQAREEAKAETLKERALDKVETKAAKLFADPEDARALLASRVDEFVDDGAVDVDAIDTALQDLLKKKPHLAAQGGRRFQGGGDGGHRGENKSELQPGLSRLQYAYAQSTKKRKS